MQILTFRNKDFLNSPLIIPGGSNAYTVSTTSGGFTGRKITSLVPTPQASASGVGTEISGQIDWKSTLFRVGSSTKAWGGLTTKKGSTREWSWSGQQYTVQFNNRDWTATRATDGSSPSVVFVPRRPHLFSADEPASISFTPGMSSEDTMFLMLVMIYSEARRQDSNRNRTNLLSVA